jgi:hypothetical protein
MDDFRNGTHLMGAMQQVLLASETADPFDQVYSGVAGTDGSSVGYAADSYGTLSPTPTPFGGTIAVLAYNSAGDLVLGLLAPAANSGWTTLTVNGVDHSRASSTYSNIGVASWRWAVTPSPFTDGVAFTAQFTQ